MDISFISIFLFLVFAFLWLVLWIASFVNWILNGFPDLYSVFLGIFSVLISIYAVYLACKTDKLTNAIADEEFDSKLAMMATYLSEANRDVSLDVARSNLTVLVIKPPMPITRISEDFGAVSNLTSFAKSAASIERKSRLITKYMIPIVDKYISLPREQREDDEAAQRIITKAYDYKLGTEINKELRRLNEDLKRKK